MMHLKCINLLTVALVTLITFCQSSILPYSIADKNPSHHQHHASPVSPSQQQQQQQEQYQQKHAHFNNFASFSSTSPSSSSIISAITHDSDRLNSQPSQSNINSDINISSESHSQSVPLSVQRQNLLTGKNFLHNSHHHNFHHHHAKSDDDEGKSLDYATTLIKEAIEAEDAGPMIADDGGTGLVNGGSSDYNDNDDDMAPPEDAQHENTGSETDSNGGRSHSDGLENTVQPSEDELFSEVQRLIQFIRESASTEKGASPKSRNNRNRLTLQMDYLQKLLNEYRQKQGSISLRHWARGVSPPRLSVTSPIAVLRDALMEEIKRKKIMETQAKIAMNEKILKEVG